MYTLLQKNNQYYETDGLIDATTLNQIGGPTYINNASGSIQVQDQEGTPIVIGPASATTAVLTYVAASNGIYRALITADMVSPLGEGYSIIVDLTTVGGAKYHRELPAVVRVGKLG